MAVIKYKNPKYTEGGSEPKYIVIPTLTIENDEVYVGTAEPTEGEKIWINPSNGLTKYKNGESWEDLVQQIDFGKGDGTKALMDNGPEMQLMSFAKMAVNAMSLTDEQALSVKLLHPEWEEFIGGSLSVGERVMYDDKLYKVKQEINPVLENQPPSIETAALYEEINEKHAGTKEDPIPFNNNMELELGKYYSQNGVTYMCFRDSQQPVYQNLADLVGIYVQIAE